jgi:hypothetical protein
MNVISLHVIKKISDVIPGGVFDMAMTAIVTESLIMGRRSVENVRCFDGTELSFEPQRQVLKNCDTKMR